MAAETIPQASQVYTWEPSNSAIARRYGLRPEAILRFDTNTAPAPPEATAELLREPFDPPLNEYPDSSYEALTNAAAAYAGVDPSRIVVGAGADEILDLVGKAFLPAGSAAAVPIPTYAMYGVLTGQRAARVVPVLRRGPADGFSLDLEQLEAVLPSVRVVWLCDPNNPTGALEPEGTVEQVLELAASVAARVPDVEPPLVVVDEAYYEFSGRTALSLTERYPNLLVVRTLSKAFALAGIRVGYAIAARETITRLERVRPPGSIGTISAQLAAAVLARPEVARATVAAIATQRARLAEGLRAAGWQPYPSVTNFLLVRIGDHEAAEAAAERLLSKGVVPRTFGPANPLRGHLRLTVRSADENERLLEAAA
jgi:histidinol-phosphate aminotransferase